ncbi:hypothetical protein B296_00004476 [Ensete ventricosum]|uniref:Uncharacterized protein n=1 Tax=Ensete ventricosum TaxID=4639 RepID=A0A427B5W2_ENSVE|nr:hypothetical protein B296_00004476 [Ensete ventricosum]
MMPRQGCQEYCGTRRANARGSSMIPDLNQTGKNRTPYLSSAMASRASSSTPHPRALKKESNAICLLCVQRESAPTNLPAFAVFTLIHADHFKKRDSVECCE